LAVTAIDVDAEHSRLIAETSTICNRLPRRLGSCAMLEDDAADDRRRIGRVGVRQHDKGAEPG